MTIVPADKQAFRTVGFSSIARPIVPSVVCEIKTLVINDNPAKHERLINKIATKRFFIVLSNCRAPREKLLGMMAGGEELDKLEIELKEMNRINN